MHTQTYDFTNNLKISKRKADSIKLNPVNYKPWKAVRAKTDETDFMDSKVYISTQKGNRKKL